MPGPVNRLPHGPERVTYHAVTRYTQRVLGAQTAEKHLDPSNEAVAHCKAAGLTVEQVRALIWTPSVAHASANGIGQVKTPEFTATLSRSGTVVTVFCPDPKKRPRMKLMSKHERRAQQHKFQRRNRCRNRNSQPTERK